MESPDYGEAGARLLRSIVEKLEEEEWLALVRERQAFYKTPVPDMKTSRLGLMLERFSSARGMTSLLEAQPEELSKTSADLRPVIDSMLQDARQVRSRRTIFAFPETVTADEWVGIWHRFLFGVAQGIIKDFRSLHAPTDIAGWSKDLELRYSFSFVGEPEPSTGAPRKQRMYSLRHHFADTLITQASVSLGKILESMQRPGPVLLEGPTGSGKTLSAKLFADHVGKHLTKINVSAIREELLEARVKGYKKGTFTGAEVTAGWFEKANGQVLLLDEFQKAPSWVQTQLLDVVSATSDDVEIARIGEETALRLCNVKLIIAINEPLETLREGNVFREDLLYRIRSLIRLSSLNSILKSDNPAGRLDLSPQAYLKLILLIYRWKFAVSIPKNVQDDLLPGMGSMFPISSPEVIETLVSWEWPGNFRELEKVCADLFYDLDRAGDDQVSPAMVARALSHRSVVSATEASRSLVKIIENALRKERFRLTKTPQHLRAHKIGDVVTLKKRLRQYRDELSSDVRDHPKIARLLRS